MTIGEKIKQLREKNSIPQNSLAAICDVSKQTLYKYENGIVTNIPSDKIERIAKALNTTPAYLMGWDEKTASNPIQSELSPKEEHHINKYRQLDNHGIDVVDTLLDKEYNRILDLRKQAAKRSSQTEDWEAEEQETAELPYYSDMAAAGNGFDLTDNGYEMLTVVKNRNTERADFIVKVSGSSMEPKYSDGDLVLVHSQPDIYEGEIGIFTINDMGYIKQKGPDRLISLNKKYKDIYVGEYDTFRCAGKVIAKLNHEDIVR